MVSRCGLKGRAVRRAALLLNSSMLWLCCKADVPSPVRLPVIVEPMTVYIVVDGLRLDTWFSAVSSVTSPVPAALAEIFGADQQKSKSLIGVRAPFPAVTFASNAGLVTGEPVFRHGIAGNYFLNRDTGLPVDFASAAGMDDVYRKELGDVLLRKNTIYAAFGGRAAVSFHFFGRGASWATPEKTDAVWFKTDPARYDYWAVGRMLGLLIQRANAQLPMPKIAMVYLPGLDEVTHTFGVSRQVDYVRGALNAALGALLDGPTGKGGGLRAMAGGLEPFTFVLAADHGHSDVREWIEQSAVDAVIEEALSAVPEYVKLSQAERAEMFFSAPDGGMMHVYVRLPGAPWTARMFDTTRGREIVLSVARALGAAPLLKEKLDMVFAGVAPDGSLRGILAGDVDPVDPARLIEEKTAFHAQNTVRYFGAVEGVHELGAEGGDIVLTADADRGFAFRREAVSGSPQRAVHGNLFAEDMRVPLVFAGRGVVPGLYNLSSGNWNAARWAAEYAGVLLQGAPAPNTDRKVEAGPIWLSAPRRWAKVSQPYVERAVAVSPSGPVIVRLVNGPPGMTVEKETGLLEWTPDIAARSAVNVTLEAEDTAGHLARLCFEIAVYDIVSAPLETAQTVDNGI